MKIEILNVILALETMALELIVIVICMVVLGKLISKINISQALKLGED